MLILGVDIAARKGGSNCGLALIDPRRIADWFKPAGDLLWARCIDGTDIRAIASVVAEARDTGAMTIGGTPENPRPEGIMLAIERQFIGVNPSIAEKLIAARIRFETIAQIRGVPFEIVYPQTWQAMVVEQLGEDAPTKVRKPPKPKAPKRGAKVAVKPVQPELAGVPAKVKMGPDTKAAARLLCSRLYPSVELTGDECDALLLARFLAWRGRPA